MKYSKKTFDAEVKRYMQKLRNKVENKVTFIIADIKNEKAFYSLAPLSRAIHELNGEAHVVIKDKKSNGLDIVKKVWHVHDELSKGLETKKTQALNQFIKEVDKRTKTKTFKYIFQRPDIVLIAEKDRFTGTLDLKYNCQWYKRYRWKELLETTKRIWKQGYNLRPNEKASIGFVLVPKEKNMELPLEDYLDSFSIAMAMGISAKKMKARVGMGSSTDKFSQLARAVRTTDLMATIRGCELDKDVDEEVFKKFKELSRLLNIDKIELTDATFGIHAKGYFGRHFFGETIGYPSLNKKTRWSSAGQLMLKDPFSPQTKYETRDPMMRYAITETLPLDIFIETCNIDYNRLKKKSEAISAVFNKCETIRVIGEPKDGFKTDFTVYLTGKDEKKKARRRYFISSDCDVTTKYDKDYLKRTGIKGGAFANFPSGEAFVTPEDMDGLMVGDIVINVDQSYVIPKGRPVVVKFQKNKGYTIIKAPSKIKKEMNKQLKEGKQRIANFEKNKSLPKEVIDVYKRNFTKVGEFAVNTNPKAKLCDYLIVNEKIAKMIHVALGSGFEPDRKSMYHWDIVVDAPKQKMDIYGIDKKNKIHWVIKKGEMVI